MKTVQLVLFNAGRAYGTTPTIASLVARKKDIDVITGLNSILLVGACSQIMLNGTLDVEKLLKTTENSIFDIKSK